MGLVSNLFIRRNALLILFAIQIKVLKALSKTEKSKTLRFFLLIEANLSQTGLLMIGLVVKDRS